MTDKTLSFEEALAKLEDIVKKMEDPTITIGDSLSLYEEGLRLSSQCSKTLEEAVLKIEEIHRTETSPDPENQAAPGTNAPGTNASAPSMDV